ncbi:MAG: molybdopterin-dependent oxidoreductase [Coriobacteriales bacterium]|nr:molybdopterin-dependent oxidoreductase [Coriobacteriales bacterium]
MTLALIAVLCALVACAPKEAPSASGAEAGGAATDEAATGVDSLGVGVVPDYPGTGRYVDSITALGERYEHAAADTRNAEENQPRIYTDRNGFKVQPVPNDPIGWNVTYLDADNRGCTSCHTLEDALMALPTYHRLIFEGYPAEQNLSNCIVCHTWSPTPLQQTIHSLHLSSKMFTEQYTGSCQNCHYIDDNGDYLRWDYVKYGVYTGYTEVPAADADLKPAWDQDTITPAANRFFKTIQSEPSEWLLDDSNVDSTIAENWTIKVTGDVENPFEMTLPELEAQFGITEQVMKNHCTVNGVGNPTIFQAKVGGISIEAIAEFAKPKEGANTYRAVGDELYHYATSLDWAFTNKALLVTQMDGAPLPPSQGYPCASWIGATSGGDFTKRVVEISIETLPEDTLGDELFLGQFVDPASGEVASKPNSGVLNYPTGVVLEDQVGKPIDFEGFADAWDEPITKVEFSLDKGQTWTPMDVTNCDAMRWVYWRMSYTPKEAGSYLLSIRTTSQQPDGQPRVSHYDTEFLFNVR